MLLGDYEWKKNLDLNEKSVNNYFKEDAAYIKTAKLSPENKEKITACWTKILGYPENYMKDFIKQYSEEVHEEVHEEAPEENKGEILKVF